MKEDILQSQIKDVELYGNFKSHKAEIDTEDLSWILQILSTNLYSDPIGSLIREYSSNAWDANVEAGNKDKPIEVGLQTSKDQGSYWYVTDLGPGLSPEKIDTIYRKFGKSTKRDSNEAIGMMGLGKFSGLSYTNEVYITTRVDGREYEYLMHKSEGIPQIDLLIDKPTTNPNGTTIKVYMQDYYDKRTFRQKMLEQLAYFENVYFNIDDNPNINEGIKLIKGKSFTYSNIDKRDLRIKLGPVSYPIDKVIKTPYNLSDYAGLALNFEIGDLAITPNRESILYNKKTIEAITLKLKEFDEELVTIYNNTSKEYEDLNAYVNALNYLQVTIGENQYSINNSLRGDLKVPTLKGLDLKMRVAHIDCLFKNYSSKGTFNGIKRSKEITHSFRYSLIKQNYPPLIVNSIVVDPKKMKYIYENNVASTNKGANMYLLKYYPKATKLKEKSYNGALSTKCYYYMLRLDTIPKTEWRKTIKKFQEWQKNFIESKCLIYDNIVVPKSWLDAQKTVTSANTNIVALRKASGNILMYFAEKASRWSGIATFTNKDVSISSLESRKDFIIYGEELYKDELRKVYILLHNYTNFKVAITAEKNHKYLKLFPQYMHVTEFLKGNNKHFRKAVGSFAFMLESKKLDKLMPCTDLITHLNCEEATELIALRQEENKLTADKSRNLSYNPYGQSNVNEELSLLVFEAVADNKIAHEYVYKIKRVNFLVEKYKFVTFFKPEGVYKKSYSKEILKFATWTAKKQKLRLNIQHYLKQEENDTTGSEGTDASEDSTID